jgi:PKD repeat protein
MQPGNTLSVTGSTGYLKQVNLFANQSRLLMGDGAYLTAANIHNAELAGQIILRASDVNFYGTTSISGTIENQGIGHETYCYGPIFNNGTIMNGENQLTFHVKENMTNDGTWSNYQTILDGDNNQFIYLQDDEEITGTVLLDSKGSSPWQWYKDGSIMPGFTGRFLTLNGISSSNYGSYYCIAAGSLSREFVICRATTAAFTSNILSGCHPLSVQFTDQSFSQFGTTTWFWDFGDGFTSEEQNPAHVYAVPGIFSVSLTICDAYNTSTTILDDYITVYQTPYADFDFSNVTIGAPVHFTDRSAQIQRQVIYETLWADTVIAFSSRYTSPEIPDWWWSEEQILGEPDVYPFYGDSVKAWAPLTANRQREFIELGYDSAMRINRVTIYETMKPGTVDTVYVKNPDGDWVIVWSGTATPQPDSSRAFQIEFPLTDFEITEIRIAMNSPAVPYWNEIDAVSISSPVDTIINPLSQYHWDMGDDTFYSTAGDVSHLYSQPGEYDVILTITNPDGCADYIAKKVTVYGTGLIPVNLRAFLQGPFSDHEMNTNLNTSGFIPLVQPYNILPWNYQGGEVVISIPDSDIVDWILIELRKSTGGPETATSDSIVSRKAGFIRRDGFITSTDGNSPVMINISDTACIYPVVMHRNHLGIIASVAISKFNGRFEYDFTSGEGQAWGAESQIPVGENKYAMVAGDMDANGNIELTDKNGKWGSEAGLSGYLQSDSNLDSQVNNIDKNSSWLPNIGNSCHVPQ